MGKIPVFKPGRPLRQTRGSINARPNRLRMNTAISLGNSAVTSLTTAPMEAKNHSARRINNAPSNRFWRYSIFEKKSPL